MFVISLVTGILIGGIVTLIKLQLNYYFNNQISPDINVPFGPISKFPELLNLVKSYTFDINRITLNEFDETISQVTSFFGGRGSSALIQVIKGQIYVDRRHFTSVFPWDKLRLHHILGQLQYILRDGNLPDFEFIFNSHDCPVRVNPITPIFSITKCIGMNVIPLPQWFAWRDGAFNNWDNRSDYYFNISSSLTWESKSSRAIFRGNVRPSVLQFDEETQILKFHNITKETFTKFGRTKLYLLGRERSDILDIGLFGKGLAEARPIIELLDYEFKPPIPMVEQSKTYKYVIYVEGACGWADRLKTLLVSGMLIFMQETPCYEFFQPMLKPWVHFIPVANDFSDLIEKVEWAQQHDHLVLEVIKSAYHFGMHYNSQEAWSYYMLKVLESYASKMNYTPKLRSGMVQFIKETKCPNKRDLQCDDQDSFVNIRE